MLLAFRLCTFSFGGTTALLLVFCYPHAAIASPLSEVALFVRCFTQLTGTRPPISHPLRQSVAAGSMTGANACISILNKASFNPTGSNEGRLTSPSDTEAVAVVNHLNDFHRTWFASDNLDAAVTDPNSVIQRDRELFDETQPALHITRSLFQPGVNYSEVVTGASGMDALRTNGSTYEPTWDGTRGFLTDAVTEVPQKLRYSSLPMGTAASGSGLENYSTLLSRGPADDPLLNPELVQTGDLLGVRKTSLNSGKMGLSVYSTVGSSISASQPFPFVYFNLPIAVHDSLGGGFIGTKTYLTLNLGRPGSTFTDGGLDMPRRWAKAILTEALCRDMPPVRSSDATIYVQRGSTLPFRNGRQCMECHSAMDPLASVARNVSIRYTGGGDNRKVLASSQLAVHPVTAGAKLGWTDIDADFFKRPPDGTLFFRSYSGDRVYLPIDGGSSAKTGMANLGAALASTNDLYVCAASRYYQLFTGIKVSLQDIGDPAKPTLTTTDLTFRDEVIRLGLAFKNHQSLRQLITDIIKLDTYKRVAPRSGN